MDLPPRTVQPRILPGPSASGTQSLAVFVVVIAALYFGRDVFVPLALAGLLSFALAPLIALLRRRGMPRTPAVLAVVIVAFLGIFVFGFVVAGQVSELGASLPRYEYNIREKVRSLQSSAPGGGFVERAGEVLRDLRKDIEEATEAPVEEEGTSPLEPEAAGQLRTGRGPGDDVADHVVVGTAYDPHRVAVAGVDIDQRQPVGVRMLRDRQHLHRPNAGDVTPGRLDALDDEADLVEPVGQFERLALDGGEVAKPGERGLHCRS